jgi:hypothetical protein
MRCIGRLEPFQPDDAAFASCPTKAFPSLNICPKMRSSNRLGFCASPMECPILVQKNAVFSHFDTLKPAASLLHSDIEV